jgi:hypothetical protein
VYEEAVKSLAGLLPARHLAPPQPIPAQTMLPIEGGGGGGRAADITLRPGQEIHGEQRVVGRLKRCSISSDQMCDVGDVGDWLGERDEIG